MSKIFVRERRRVEPGLQKPRFRVVAVSGVEVKFRANHVRRAELDAIAEAVGAEIVVLPDAGDGSGEGLGNGAGCA
ncbi:MAG: hypothetical protein KKC99_02470, partial [Proteobacteria bacterium]|nr:hypothetical protein [Pseudomonadota bacterium]